MFGIMMYNGEENNPNERLLIILGNCFVRSELSWVHKILSTRHCYTACFGYITAFLFCYDELKYSSYGWPRTHFHVKNDNN